MSYRISIFTICFVLFAALAARPAGAQTDSSGSHISLSLGLGANFAFMNEGSFTELGQVRYEIGHILIGVRYLHADGSILNVQPDETIDDLSIMAGYGTRFGILSLGAEAGIGYEAITTRGAYLGKEFDTSIGDLADTYQSLNSHAISVPIQLEAMIMASDSFGIGTFVYEHINSQRSNPGISVVARLIL